MVSVPAVTLVVLVSVGKETPLSSTVPLSSDDVPSPKTGWGGAAISPNPPPPIVHRVSVDSNGGPSRLFTFAPLPCMCSVTPVSFGISNCTGLVLEVAAKCQAASALYVQRDTCLIRNLELHRAGLGGGREMPGRLRHHEEAGCIRLHGPWLRQR